MLYNVYDDIWTMISSILLLSYLLLLSILFEKNVSMVIGVTTELQFYYKKGAEILVIQNCNKKVTNLLQKRRDFLTKVAEKSGVTIL